MSNPRSHLRVFLKQRSTAKTLSSLKYYTLRELGVHWWTVHPDLCFVVVSMLWVALLYARTISEPFVYDDVLAIQQNPDLSSWHDVLRCFRLPVQLNNEYRGFAGSIYRPLVWLGFVINHKASGSGPAGFHITNLILHWANGVIGFFLLRTLRISPMMAAATCLIWLGLPINSEAVAWISGRHTCQAAFFIVTSLLMAVGYARQKSTLLVFGYMAALLGALLSNEWGILALPLMGLVIYLESPKEQRTWFYLCLGSVSMLALQLVMRQAAGAGLPLGSLKILPVGLSFLKYLSWIVLPVHMSVERSTDTPSNEITTNSIVALAGVACFLLFLVLKLRKQAPQVAAGLAWLSICLLPWAWRNGTATWPRQD